MDGGGGGGGGEGGRLHTYRYIVTPRMTALRWAAMRAILMFHLIVRDEVTRQCPGTNPAQPF